MRKVLMQDGEFILTVDDSGSHTVYHCHCDECGGGRNGPPYWASCDITRQNPPKLECHDCPASVPDAMIGIVKLAMWER